MYKNIHSSLSVTVLKSWDNPQVSTEKKTHIECVDINCRNNERITITWINLRTIILREKGEPQKTTESVYYLKFKISKTTQYIA